jgi:hypothetical protein
MTAICAFQPKTGVEPHAVVEIEGRLTPLPYGEAPGELRKRRSAWLARLLRFHLEHL